MFELNFFPLWGLVLGADYLNDEMEEIQFTEEKVHTISIYLLMVGVQIKWFTNRS